MFTFHIITLFPDLIESCCEASIIGRGIKNQRLCVRVYDPRQYCKDKYRKVDDTPYGGGAGMVLKPEPIFAAFEDIRRSPSSPVIITSPQGRLLNQNTAEEFSVASELTVICGHYEGADERIHSLATHEVSIGDYVLTGGELAALVIIDAVGRLVPGVLGTQASLEHESFSDHLLEGPHYTKPPDFKGMEVPEVLKSGDHQAIAKWRRQQALRRTCERRPDLLAKATLSDEDRKFINGLSNN